MTYEELRWMILGAISELSESQQLIVNDLVDFMKKKYNEHMTEMALAISLVSLELQIN